MASVIFYAEKARQGQSLLLAVFTFMNTRIRLSTGIAVSAKAWDQHSQKAKPIDDYASINRRLREIKSFLMDKYDEVFKPGMKFSAEEAKLKGSEIKEAYRIFTGKKRLEAKTTMTIYAFVDVFKQRYTNKLSNNYLKHYTSLKNHLQEFERESGFKVSFETINKEFYLLFTDYLSSKGKKINTIGANIRRLKRLMNEAVEDNLTDNLGHRSRNFKVLNEEVDMIYLSEKEIEEYYIMELDNDRYRYIRDLFVLHCHTGLRHSDWSKLSQENIRDGNLTIKTQKTKEYVVIPMHPVVLDVLNKYEGKTVIPTNQEVNRVLKYIGEYARVNKISEGSNVKWTQITTHTARRSFATNAYLAGIPMLAIMKITGHKKTETFLRYIRVTKLENAMKLKDHPFFNR